MGKLTIPVERHPAYAVLANMARNDEIFCEGGVWPMTGNVVGFSTRYFPENLLRPHLTTSAAMVRYGLVDRYGRVTERGKKVADAAMVWGDFSAWQGPVKILGEKSNPVNLDVAIYMKERGPMDYPSLESGLSGIYSDAGYPSGIVPTLRQAIGRQAVNFKPAVRHLVKGGFLNEDGKDIKEPSFQKGRVLSCDDYRYGIEFNRVERVVELLGELDWAGSVGNSGVAEPAVA